MLTYAIIHRGTRSAFLPNFNFARFHTKNVQKAGKHSTDPHVSLSGPASQVTLEASGVSERRLGCGATGGSQGASTSELVKKLVSISGAPPLLNSGWFFPVITLQ